MLPKIHQICSPTKTRYSLLEFFSLITVSKQTTHKSTNEENANDKKFRTIHWNTHIFQNRQVKKQKVWGWWIDFCVISRDSTWKRIGNTEASKRIDITLFRQQIENWFVCINRRWSECQMEEIVFLQIQCTWIRDTLSEKIISMKFLN